MVLYGIQCLLGFGGEYACTLSLVPDEEDTLFSSSTTLCFFLSIFLLIFLVLFSQPLDRDSKRLTKKNIVVEYCVAIRCAEDRGVL